MTFTGMVQRGTGRASALGFPTVNISLANKNLSGIYAAKVTVDGREYIAAAYADQKRGLLEAYLFNFSGNLYGREISAELYKKIREDKNFTDDLSLREAIAADTRAVTEYFKP